MQLIMAPASPYVRKVRVAIRECGLDHQVTEVEVATTALDPAPEALAANPTGRIPALVRDGAPAIYDSRVITRFLNAHAVADLYPEARLWEVLTLEATGEGMLDSAVGMVYQARFVGTDGPSADWIEAQWAKVTGALSAIEGRWMSHLAGPLDMGQVAVACALGYLDFRHGDRDWRAIAPALGDWFTTFSDRPSMIATIPG